VGRVVPVTQRLKPGALYLLPAGACADVRVGRINTLKSGAKTVRRRIVFIRPSPWPQGLRRELVEVSRLIFYDALILHPLISQHIGENALHMDDVA